MTIVLTGTGERAFCTGGDQSAHSGQYDGRGTAGLPIEELHSLIRDVPKPVIARVQGFAIGGVAPLGHLSPPVVLVDRDLAAFDSLWAAAGSPTHVFATTPDELLRISGGAWAVVREG